MTRELLGMGCLAGPRVGEGDDELVERKSLLDGLDGGHAVVGRGGAVGLGLVKDFCARYLCGDFEGVDGVRESV